VRWWRVRSVDARVPVPGAAGPAPAQPPLSGPATEFSVLAREGHGAGGYDVAAAEKAVRAAGGTVVTSNAAAGLITATAPADGFTDRVSGDRAVFGVARAKAIGTVPKDGKPRPKPDVVAAGYIDATGTITPAGDEGRNASYTATCVGDASFNGFYGHGAVDAWSAVTRGGEFLRG
jgi:hypothetical protein